MYLITPKKVVIDVDDNVSHAMALGHTGDVTA